MTIAPTPPDSIDELSMEEPGDCDDESLDEGTLEIDLNAVEEDQSHEVEETDEIHDVNIKNNELSLAVKKKMKEHITTLLTRDRCIQCGYSSPSVGAMARHRLAHSGWSRPFLCPFCPRRCATSSILATHIHRIHGDGTGTSLSPLVVRKENQKSSQLTFAISHPQQLVLNRCPACPFTCAARDEMMSHQRHHCHRVVANMASRWRFACDSCTFAVNVQNALMNHRRLHLRGHC